MKAANNNIIVKNKNAARNYHLTDKYQAGIVLEGWEVKGLRDGKVDVKDSYVTLKNNEAWVIGLKIDPPASLMHESIDPTGGISRADNRAGARHVRPQHGSTHGFTVRGSWYEMCTVP